MTFPAVFQLSSLDGTNGFALNGINANDSSGSSVSSAGDVNGDGFADLIIGAVRASPNGYSSGQSYVVFGSSGGFSASLNLSTLNGTNGFALNGINAFDFSGSSVSSAGDVNGDGFDDLIIGARNASPNGSFSGQSYVVFGRSGGFSASLNLSTLDGTNGFALNGINAFDFSGSSVSSAGDVNGDGFDDLIIGARNASPNGSFSGQSYVVFGRSGGFSASLNLSTLDGTNGFALNGINNSDNSGFSVSSAGDVNGDDFDDLIIGASSADPNGSYSGQSYVVFGRSGGFSASLNLSTLNGSNGFALNGINARDNSGWSVSSAGDINGDGFDDIIIGAYGADPNGSFSGQSYVVFGRSGGFSASLNLSTLDGTNGFALNGINASDFSGRSVSSAGDINGDDFDDIIIGASSADPNGSYSGQSYVVFGSSGGFSASLNLSTLNGTNGFALNGINAIDSSGWSVSSAGDVNGDDFDDLIIGATGADPNGSGSGQSYVVFGRGTSTPLPSITLAVSPVSVTENGTTNIVYTFTRTGSLTTPLTVDYTIGGTATNGTDYATIGTSVTFAAGSATAIVTVDPTTDTTVEENETVALTLVSNAGYTIGTIETVTGTITNQVPVTNPTFATPIINPFGLLDVGSNSIPTLVDLDGDNDLDVFVGEGLSGNTFFYQNIGNASSPAFAAPIINPFGLPNVGNNSSPTFGDLDGDGDLDAFLGEAFGHTVFSRNIGTSTNPAFEVPIISPFGLSSVGSYSSPSLVDLDGDNDLDVFVGEVNGNTFFFKNTGSATSPAFATPIINPFGLPNVGAFSSPTFEDLDEDGDLDAFLGELNGNTVFSRNTGNSTNPAFELPTISPFGLTSVGVLSNPAFGDLDADGDLDAIVGEVNGNTVFYRNTSLSSTVNLAVSSNIGSEAGTTVISVLATSSSAVKGNQTVNLAVRNLSETTNITLGDYSLSSNTITILNEQTTGSVTFTVLNDTLVEGTEIATLTLNNPSSGLLLGSTIYQNITITDNEVPVTNPTFTTPIINPFGLTDVGSNSIPTLVDLDGDNDLDVFVGEGLSGNTFFYQNTGTATTPAFATPVINPFGLPNVGNNSSPTFGDIDGDGDLDAFMGEAFGNTVFCRNTGSATNPVFELPIISPFGLPNVGRYSSPTLGDLDGDGDLDILLGELNGNTVFSRNTGSANSPAFELPVINPFGLPNVGAFSSPTLGDIDGDGDLDVLLGELNGNTVFSRNTGSLTNPAFELPSISPFGLTSVGVLSNPAFGDLDADGDLDAIVGEVNGNTVFYRNTSLSLI